MCGARCICLTLFGVGSYAIYRSTTHSSKVIEEDGVLSTVIILSMRRRRTCQRRGGGKEKNAETRTEESGPKNAHLRARFHWLAIQEAMEEGDSD